MSIIRLHKKEKFFLVLDKTCLSDTSLSWKAKGLHTYLMSLPDDWKVYMEDLNNRSKDGRESTRTAMHELIEHGFVVRTPHRKESGEVSGWDYDIYEVPQNSHGTGVFRDYGEGPKQDAATKEEEVSIGAFFGAWKSCHGGNLMLGVAGMKALRDLIKTNGRDQVLDSWITFCRSQDSKYGWKNFIQYYGRYVKAKPMIVVDAHGD